jgi:hypothetical protein
MYWLENSAASGPLQLSPIFTSVITASPTLFEEGGV